MDDMLASQRHAKIERIENSEDAGGADYFIEDLKSTNHTYINGTPIERKKLVHNDVIRIGKHKFKFLDESAEPADKTTKLRKSRIPGVDDYEKLNGDPCSRSRLPCTPDERGYK